MKRRSRRNSGFGASHISESESEDSSEDERAMPTIKPRNKDQLRVRRDDETPSPYSFTKSDIEQLDLEDNEESIAEFKVFLSKT